MPGVEGIVWLGTTHTAGEHIGEDEHGIWMGSASNRTRFMRQMVTMW